MPMWWNSVSAPENKEQETAREVLSGDICHSGDHVADCWQRIK